MSNVVFLGPVVRALLRRTEVCVDSAIFSSVFSPPRVGGRSAGNACALRGTRAGPWSLARCRGESTVERNSETLSPAGRANAVRCRPSQRKQTRSPMSASCTSVCCQSVSAQRDTGAGDSRPPAGRERPLNSPRCLP